MNFKNLNNYLVIILTSLALVAGLAYYFAQFAPKAVLVIGAGAASGEAYHFAQAIKAVAEMEYPELTIQVQETKGSEENMALLENGTIDLATVQGDIIQSDLNAASSARIVSILYEDIFQLIVHPNSGIRSFADLPEKSIALPRKGGGQWQSFWFIADHYGINEKDIMTFELNARQADVALINNEIDAIFRVRSPRNTNIQALVDQGVANLVSINQAASLALKQPACKVTELPPGAYSAKFMVPESALTTLAVDRYLLASKNAPDKAIAAVARMLSEHQLALRNHTPLAGFIHRPTIEEGTLIPVHGGALQHYNRNKPSFIVEKADFIALLISVFLLISSTLLSLRRRFKAQQKNTIDQYTFELVQTMKDIQKVTDPVVIEQSKASLRDTLQTVVYKLDRDEVNIEGFQFFSFVWDATLHAIEERADQLKQPKKSET